MSYYVSPQEAAAELVQRLGDEYKLAKQRLARL